MHWKGAAAVGAALVLSAGGCGGSKPLSKAEFVKQADAVCVRSRAQEITMLKTAVAQKKAQHLSETQARAEFIPRIVAIEQRELSQLESLKPPGELQAAFAQWKRALGVEIKQNFRSNPTPAQHAQFIAAAAQRARLKGTLGFKQC